MEINYQRIKCCTSQMPFRCLSKASQMHLRGLSDASQRLLRCWKFWGVWRLILEVLRLRECALCGCEVLLHDERQLLAAFGPNLHLAAKGLQRAPIETSTPPFCSILCVDSDSGIDTSSGSADLRPSGQIFTWPQKPSTSTNRDGTTILQHCLRRF